MSKRHPAGGDGGVEGGTSHSTTNNKAASSMKKYEPLKILGEGSFGKVSEEGDVHDKG